MAALLRRSLRSATPTSLSTPLPSLSRHFSASAADPSKLRNVAVIARGHHDKTTLIDTLSRYCSHRERDITVASKVTSISWKENELKMVDTPGKAYFDGEVDRVFGMVEGAILVVDVGEGPSA